MNASGSESASGGVDGNASASASAGWTVSGSANENGNGNENENGNENGNGNGSESEGIENGRSVYGSGGTRARVRIHDLFARHRSDRSRGRESDSYRDGNLGVAACRLRHARPSFPSENGEIIWARCVGS